MILKFGKYNLFLLFLCVQLLVVIYFISTASFSYFFSKNINRPYLNNGELPEISEDISKLFQTDAELISFAKQFILPPSTLPYTFDKAGYTKIVLLIWTFLQKIVKDGQNGFFVEAGAYDGVAASNTLGLEVHMHWKGLLVECHPKSLELLKNKHRRSFIAQSCLSASNHSQMATMTSVSEWNPASSLNTGNIFGGFKNFSEIKVPTFPLYTLLSAIEVQTVDFFSLDVQSLEYDVLKNFPFEKIFVKSWLIEVDLLQKDDQTSLVNLMVANGYGLSLMIGGDYFFLHKSVAS